MSGERKIIGSRHNPDYNTAPYEIAYLDKENNRLTDSLGQGVPLMPYRYATLDHAQAAIQPGANPRVNTVWPELPVYEDEEL